MPPIDVALGAVLGTALAASVANYAPPPGAFNPQVTQASIAATICKRGWTASVRPPRTFTDNLKQVQISQRHLPGGPAAYEEDHFIPLELGGAPRDPKNLWPQRRANGEAAHKDRLENVLNKAVCGKKLTLAAARTCIQRDWIACARRMGVR